MDTSSHSINADYPKERTQWNPNILPEENDPLLPKTARPTSFRKMYLAALAALMSAVAMGMAITYSSPATPDMESASSPVKVTKDDISWIGSLVALGALFGGASAGFLSEKLGRKGALIVNSIPFTAGWLCIAYAGNVELIFAGRVVTGFCCGVVSVTAPVYVVEISTAEVRGRLGTSFQLFVVIGILLVVSLGAGLHWQWLAVACLVEVVLALVLICPMPESPRWLLARQRRSEAVAALIYLQGDDFDVEHECSVIEEDLLSQPKSGIKLREFAQPAIYKPALLSFGLMMFQQACGMGPIIFYTVSIFQSADKEFNSSLAAIIVNIVQVFFTLISSLIIDKTGRRVLLMISGLGMALSLSVMGAYEFMVAKDASFSKYGWMSLASLIVFVTSFSIGYGPIAWMMMPEMIPVRARSLVAGAAAAFNWMLVFIFTKMFDAMISAMHEYGVYWFFSSISILSIFFALLLLPETKGKPLEEIQTFFVGKKR